VTIPDIAFDTEVWPQLGRGGWMRNYNGEAVVSHPSGGTGTLIYEGASGLLEFKPYRGDPAHGERGQLVHDIVYLALNGMPINADILARGEALGVSGDLIGHIYGDWDRHADEHGIHAPIIEGTVVVDEWKVATNIDLLCGDIVRDIKTAGSYVQAGYLVQLAAGSRSLPYDVATGKRGEWPTPLNRDLAYIDHFPINTARQAEPADWPSWEAHPVQLAHGHFLGDALYAIKNDVAHKAAFDPPRQRGEHVSAINARHEAVRDLKARQVDEGDTIDAALVVAMGERFKALDDAQRSWVGACNAGVRLSGKPTVRRFEALRGLLILADSGFDNDDAVRAIGWHIFGDVAHFANVKPATIIAALDVEQATRFAALCERLGDGHGDMRFTQDARCFIDGLAA
jgi:hypothetical protein